MAMAPVPWPFLRSERLGFENRPVGIEGVTRVAHDADQFVADVAQFFRVGPVVVVADDAQSLLQDNGAIRDGADLRVFVQGYEITIGVDDLTVEALDQFGEQCAHFQMPHVVDRVRR